MVTYNSQGQKQTKTIGEFYEKVDFSNDPNVFLFYRHILTGLTAFSNPQQTAEESFAKYKVMLRIAEGFLSEKFGVDFTEIRKRIANETSDDAERLAKEVQEIAKVLDSSVRKVEIQLVWDKKAKGNSEDEVVDISNFSEEDVDEIDSSDTTKGLNTTID